MSQPFDSAPESNHQQKVFLITNKRFGKLHEYKFSTSKSLFLFGPKNALRRFAVFVCVSEAFQNFIILTILVNCVFLAMPDLSWSDITEYIFFAIYVAEMMVKVVAKGFVLNKHAYLRDPWNGPDFFVIISATVTLIVERVYPSVSLANLNVLRTFRVLRALRTMTTIPGLRTIVGAYFMACRMLVEVTVLTLFCLFTFSTFSLQLFMGSLRQKCVKNVDLFNVSDSSAVHDFYHSWIHNPENWLLESDGNYRLCGNSSLSRCDAGYTCLRDIGGNPNYGFTNFDNFGWALLNTFQLLTLDFWEDVHDKVATTYGESSELFFFVVVFFGAFYLINMMLAVVAMSYEKEVNHDEEEELRARKRTVKETVEEAIVKLRVPDQDANVSATYSAPADVVAAGTRTDEATRESFSKREGAGRSAPGERGARTVQSFVHGVVADPLFECAITMCIALNTLCLAGEHHQEAPGVTLFLKIANYVFTTIFTLEAVLKIFALRRQYFASGWNRFDFVIVLAGIFDVASESVGGLIGIRTFRLLRIVKLAQNWTTMHMLLTIIIKTMGALLNLTIVLAITIYIFAIIGYQLFGFYYKTFDFEGTEGERWHFKDFFHSCMMVFRVLCGEWVEPLWQCMRAVSPVCIALFLPTLVVGNFIVLNLFLAMLLNAFAMETMDKHLEEIRESRVRMTIVRFQTFLASSIHKLKERKIQPAEGPQDNAAAGMDDTTIITTVTAASYETDIQKEPALDSKNIGGLRDGDHYEVEQASAVGTQLITSQLMTYTDTFRERPEPLPSSPVDAFDTLVDLHARRSAPPVSTGNRDSKNLFLSVPPRHSQTDPWSSQLSPSETQGSLSRHTFPEQPDTEVSGPLHPSTLTLPPRQLSDPQSTVSEAASAKVYQLPGAQESDSFFILRPPPVLPTQRTSITVRECPEGETSTGGEVEAMRESSWESLSDILAKENARLTEPPKCLPDCVCKSQDESYREGFLWKFRVSVLRFVDNRAFEYTILVVIFASSTLLVFDDIYLYQKPSLGNTLYFLDIGFGVIFILEMMLKMAAFGLKKYFTSFWTLLDFFVVVVTVLSLLEDQIGLSHMAALRSVRTLRALRPLRVISYWEGIRIILGSLFKAIPSMVNVFLVGLVFWLMFGIMGVQLFAGKFYKCINATTGEALDHTVVPDKARCQASGELWQNSKVNFDNIFQAYLALFQMATLEGWMEIIQDGVDSTEVDKQPEFESSLYVACFYFVVFILFGSFFILNLFISVIIDNYLSTKKMYDGVIYLESRLTPEERAYYHAVKLLVKRSPAKIKKRPENACKRFLTDVVESGAFDATIKVIIILNVAVLASNYYKRPREVAHVTEIVSWIFGAIYVLEAVAKIIVYGMAYFKDVWNLYDFSVAALVILEFALRDLSKNSFSPTLLRAFQVFRITRITRLAKWTKGIRRLLHALFVSLPSIFSIGSLLMLIITIYTFIGMSSFRYVKLTGSLTARSNFQTFLNGMLLLLRLATASGWNDVLDSLLISEPDCDPDFRTLPDGTKERFWQGDCGNAWLAVPYMVSYIIIVYLIVINMYIAVILENFYQVQEQKTQDITSDAIDMFYDTWERYDPAASQFIHYSQLSDFVSELEDPLRLRKPNRITLSVFDLDIVEGDRLHFLDIILALLDHSLGVTRPSPKMRVLKEEMHLKLREMFPERVGLPVRSSTMQRYRADLAARTIQRAWRRRLTRRRVAHRSSFGFRMPKLPSMFSLPTVRKISLNYAGRRGTIQLSQDTQQETRLNKLQLNQAESEPSHSLTLPHSMDGMS